MTKTDQELTDRFLRRLGVPFKVKTMDRPEDHYEAGTFVHLMIQEIGDNARVRGYAGFMTEFVFTEAGEFCYMGLWE